MGSSKTKHTIRRERQKQVKNNKKEKTQRQKRRKITGETPPPTKTIESTREPDSTIIGNNAPEEIISEITGDIDTDELSSYYAGEYEPKVLITFSEKPVKRSRTFASQLCKVIPNCIKCPRNNASIKAIINQSIKRDFTDILIINEDRYEPNGLLLIHLPEGPTAYFRLSNVCTSSKKQVREMTNHRPEVMLNNFNTRLGQTIARMLGAIFHYQPDFKGRRAVTLHNQRDYIFFRHHRYKFIKGQTALRELGPKFTLKLQHLQRGTFDSKYGEFEWTMTGKRHELETSRRRFFL